MTSLPRLSRRTVAFAVALVGGTVLLGLVYGFGAVGSDGQWSLYRGHEVITGHVPSVGAPLAPTSHPLTMTLGALVALVGGTGPVPMGVAELLALSAVVVCVWRFAEAAFGSLVAWIAAGLTLACPWLAVSATNGTKDTVYAVLLLVAGRIELRRPRAGTPVLVLLSLGGFVRPEAWILAGLYAATILRDPARRRPIVPLLVVVPPALWLGEVWAITGSPLTSLHETRHLRGELGRDTGVEAALEHAPHLMGSILGSALLAVGVLGAVLVAVSGTATQRRLLGWSAVLYGAFLVQSAAGFSVIARYALPNALLLLVLGAAAVGGAIRTPGIRRGLVVAAAAVTLLSGLPDRKDALDDARATTRAFAESWTDLDAVLTRADARAACGPVDFAGPPDWRPIVALRTGVPVTELRSAAIEPPVAGLRIVAVDHGLRGLVDSSPGSVRVPAPPGDAQLVARTERWSVWRVCPPSRAPERARGYRPAAVAPMHSS